MKKLFLGVVMFALIFSSCNKYANDFQALKDQISALSTKVDGVIALQNTISSQTATIAAIQTAVNALPATIAGQFTTLTAALSAVSTKIDGIKTTLDAVAANGLATKSVVDGLKTTLDKVVADKLLADAALNKKLDDLQAALTKAIGDGTTANAAAVAAAQKAITDAIAASIMTNDANVKTRVDAAVAAIGTAITTSANKVTGDVNANTNKAIADAQTAILAAFDAKLAALKTALQTSITDGTASVNLHTDAQITALTTAMNVGFTAVGTQNTATQTQLATAKTAILNAILASQSEIDGAIETAKNAIHTYVTDAVTAVDGHTDAQIAALNLALQTLINANNTAMVAQINGVQTAIIGGSSDTVTSNTITGLQLALAAAQRDISTLLAASAMINEDVTITTDAEVNYWAGKITQWSIINGNVSVNTTAITAPKIAALNTILNNIGAVIGNNPAAAGVINFGFWFTGWEWWEGGLSGAGSGTIYLTPVAGTRHWVIIASAHASDWLQAKKLVSVAGSYSVLGYDIADDMIANVGGTVTLDYGTKAAGSDAVAHPATLGYVSSTLLTVGGDLRLVTPTTYFSGVTGLINIPNVVLKGYAGDAFGGAAVADGHVASTAGGPATGTVVFPGTTSIDLGLATGGQINDLTANSATSIRLRTIVSSGLAIQATVATTINLQDMTSTTTPGAIAITTSAWTNVWLQNLATSFGNITVNMAAWTASGTGNVDLSAYNAPHVVTLNGPQVVNKLGSWWGAAGSLLSASVAETVSLPLYQWVTGPNADLNVIDGSEAVMPAVKYLTLGGAAGRVVISNYPTLVTADITGTVWKQSPALATDWWENVSAGVRSVVNASPVRNNALLTDLTLRGLFGFVDLFTLPKLKTVNTSGIISGFTLDNAGTDASVTNLALNLMHTNFIGAAGHGGPGSDMVITNNPKVTTLTTHTDRMSSLRVTGNATLAAMDFSSYVIPVNYVSPASTQVEMTIRNNHLSGGYTPALVPTAETGYVEATITSAALKTLRTYVNTCSVAQPLGTLTLVLQLDVDQVDGSGSYGLPHTLGFAMDVNKIVSTVISDARDANTAISTKAEMNLIIP